MFDIKTTIEIGGIPQKIHIRGTREGHPVILFLHGGPGGANRHDIMKHYTAICDQFTIVGWDQRGTGGSFEGADFAHMTIQRMVDDAKELVDYLCERYGQKKVFIVGGSWGTELGTYLADQYPGRIGAYVGYGQLVDAVRNEELSYQFTLDEATKAGDTKALETLRRVGPPVNGAYKPLYDGMMEQREIMKKYGGHNVKKGSYFLRAYVPVIFTMEYTLREKFNMLKGFRLSIDALWPEMAKCDFIRRGPNKFQVPYYIFQGRYDQNTPSALVPEYYDMLQAPDKDLIWFEHSAHSPLYEEPERFARLLREKLGPIQTK